MENKQNYKKCFLDLVKISADNELIGSGNPNASILIIGQEKSQAESGDNGEVSYTKDWNGFLSDGREKPFCDNCDTKYMSGHTWYKYQKLHDAIFPEHKTNIAGKINFENRIFTTEMNVGIAKRNADARKDLDFKRRLENRKKTYLKSNFIQQFPVIILANSKYFTANDKINDICDIFNVNFIGDENGKYTYSKGNWFAIYKNANDSKLVIHTRQLSNNVDSLLLEDMGKVIRCFLDENKIQLSSLD